MAILWNPWHGCKKFSEGCLHCYVFRIDEKHEKQGDDIRLNRDFLLPLRKKREDWKIPSGETLYTCFTSDFLLEEADEWREDVWRMMRERQDLSFIFFTKRILRLASVLPADWGEGYPNVTVGCTCENQKRADERLPVFLSLPIRNRMIICEPLLEEVNLAPYLNPRLISSVTAGGESGNEARLCSFDWILRLKTDCDSAGIPFSFHQTGANFEKDGKRYCIPRRFQQEQARKAFGEEI